MRSPLQYRLRFLLEAAVHLILYVCIAVPVSWVTLLCTAIKRIIVPVQIHPDPKVVLITGAASGLGAGLAKRYAKEGVTLFLSDVNENGLNATSEACQKLGAKVHIAKVDVTVKESVESWVSSCDRQAPIELVVACAGIAAVTSGIAIPNSTDVAAVTHHDRFPDIASRVMNVNVMGVVHTVTPLLAAMKRRGYGQIAAIASLAAYTTSAYDPAYPASKVAVLTFMQSLRHAYLNFGVRVNAICPAFIETPLTASFKGPKPLQITLDQGLDEIVDGLKMDEPVVVFPPTMHAFASVTNTVPWPVKDALAHLPVVPWGGYIPNKQGQHVKAE